MRILFLDDMGDRHRTFESKFGKKFTITHAYSYEEFIDIMENEEDFDVLFLDHDLSNKAIMCNPNDDIGEKTGTDIARWLVGYFSGDYADDHKPSVIVHSLNPAGRENMVNILNDAGFEVKGIPFFMF